MTLNKAAARPDRTGISLSTLRSFGAGMINPGAALKRWNLRQSLHIYMPPGSPMRNRACQKCKKVDRYAFVCQAGCPEKNVAIVPQLGIMDGDQAPVLFAGTRMNPKRKVLFVGMDWLLANKPALFTEITGYILRGEVKRHSDGTIRF